MPATVLWTKVRRCQLAPLSHVGGRLGVAQPLQVHTRCGQRLSSPLVCPGRIHKAAQVCSRGMGWTRLDVWPLCMQVGNTNAHNYHRTFFGLGVLQPYRRAAAAALHRAIQQHKLSAGQEQPGRALGLPGVHVEQPRLQQQQNAQQNGGC